MLQETKTTANNDSYNKTQTQRQEDQNQQGLRVLYTVQVMVKPQFDLKTLYP